MRGLGGVAAVRMKGTVSFVQIVVQSAINLAGNISHFTAFFDLEVDLMTVECAMFLINQL